MFAITNVLVGLSPLTQGKSNSSMFLRSQTNRKGLPGRRYAIYRSVTSFNSGLSRGKRQFICLSLYNWCIHMPCSMAYFKSFLKFKVHSYPFFLEPMTQYDATEVWQANPRSLIGHFWVMPPCHKMSVTKKSVQNRPLSEQIE